MPKCLLCEGDAFIEIPYFFRYDEKQIRIVQCAACGLSTLDPMLSPDEVVLLYQSEYFEKDYRCGCSAGGYGNEVEDMQRQFQPYLAMIQTLCPRGKFLEIGCAGGATLAAARQRGFDTIGVELSAEMADWGRKNLHLDIRAGTLEQQRFTDSTFDVVYLGDVIEHLLQPRAVLQEIYRILRPEGVVALAYPMELNHLAPRLRRLLHIPRQSPHKPYHLFYYTNQTLGKLLEQCRFKVKMEKVEKIRQQQPIWIYALDSFNYALTKTFGIWGDRGFTIASPQPK